jgi:hypothetical protein
VGITEGNAFRAEVGRNVKGEMMIPAKGVEDDKKGDERMAENGRLLKGGGRQGTRWKRPGTGWRRTGKWSKTWHRWWLGQSTGRHHPCQSPQG